MTTLTRPATRAGFGRAAAFGLLVGALAPSPGWAEGTVSLQGTMGQRALVIVGGGAPRALAPGESHQGVKLLSVGAGEADVEIAGRRQTLRVGDSPASVGGGTANKGRRIVLTAGSHGHFTGLATVNGRPMRFMVDTGASMVGIGSDDAERLGLDHRSGRPVTVSTANGPANGWQLKLTSLRIGDVEVFNVDAIVVSRPMPQMLLGNSFLTRFQMTRENDQMVLERRY
ncbi:retropepsin-like aspartic protease family protein [Ramlibacter aurantiacus]|uniref:retropepsin-like aspartic protease family protein n=1 Tax=Ramlibacter aurantiacus TaxID=2801330 RepID=UPI001F3E3566|nr:TIGR02281 family clan AA aspartic protease [Ramlibacter aurantiacus]